MPFIDGFESTMIIRELLSNVKRKPKKEPLDVKIIAITGHIEPEYI